jgi:diguanylate cyclase (GGDEF)-like protein
VVRARRPLEGASKAPSAGRATSSWCPAPSPRLPLGWSTSYGRPPRERHLAELYDELLRKEAELERLAITDALTGLYNRRFFTSRLAAEVARARRYGRVLSLVMLDLDNFKEINDQHGHQVGDHVLAEVGKILTTNVRASDIVCRYGGEEFAVLLPETGPEAAGRAAEAARLSEGALPGGRDLPPAVSLGWQAIVARRSRRRALVRCADAPPPRRARAG